MEVPTFELKTLFSIRKVVDVYLHAPQDGMVAAIERATFEMDQAILRATLELDGALGKRANAGSTIASCFIFDGRVYMANVGHSRVLLVRDSRVVAKTRDHRPTDRLERLRIESAGGRVTGGRVDGVLSLSRCMGAFRFKESGRRHVSAQPSVLSRSLSDVDCVVLASDGILDEMSSADVAAFAGERVGLGARPEDVCEALVNRCKLARPRAKYLGYGDNLTVVILVPAKSPETFIRSSTAK